MRPFLTCTILTLTILTAGAAPAHAQHGPYAKLVDGWYHRYLARHVDHAGLHDHTHALRHGTPIDVVEAAILSSREYYQRNGHTPEGYVAALYRDVLGRRAGAFEFNRDVNGVLTYGRNAVALRLIGERNVLTAAPVIVASAPVYLPRPVVAPPVVVVPSYRPAPLYLAPPPGISIRIGIR